METIKLKIANLKKRFRGIEALKDISFDLNGNEIIGLIGPNGAGKTTFVNVLTGVYKPNGGSITLQGEHIEGLPTYIIVRKGIGRTFQVTRGFRLLSVLENLIVPGLAVLDKSRKVVERKAKEVLGFLTLDQLKDEYAENLSGGQQKLLELGRVLMLDPDILLLDEPFAGVHPKLREKIYKYIREIHKSGKAFIIISHDMSSIFTLSERIIVFDEGKKIADGSPDEVRQSDAVVEAYLGD